MRPDVNVVATVYGLFKNFMDGLRLAWMGRVFQNFEPVQNSPRPDIRRSNNVLNIRWMYYELSGRTSILLGT